MTSNTRFFELIMYYTAGLTTYYIKKKITVLANRVIIITDSNCVNQNLYNNDQF